MYIINVFSQSL